MPALYLLPLALLPEGWALGLLLSALLLGLPHGAADLLIARRLGLPLGGFVALYLLLALPPLLALLAHPPLGLLGFLLLALLHWGRVEGRGGLGFLRAGVVLGFPLLFHREAIGPFLQAFAGGYAPPPLPVALLLGLLLWALAEGHAPRAWWGCGALGSGARSTWPPWVGSSWPSSSTPGWKTPWRPTWGRSSPSPCPTP
ncbi:Brp/Blh family beta-carotene 15,15'-dioxygenase [Thermus sp.]|uniref:Brp/Blh family beta-carotene 15,15'-dioxygenase n=1 Tax=Thermus sp. TaxID=275 RepID=UPI00307F14FB